MHMIMVIKMPYTYRTLDILYIYNIGDLYEGEFMSGSVPSLLKLINIGRQWPALVNLCPVVPPVPTGTHGQIAWLRFGHPRHIDVRTSFNLHSNLHNVND